MFSKILFYWRPTALVTFVLSAIFLSACSDDDPAEDPTLSQVTINSPATGSDAVWNTVTFSINAANNDGVASVEIKVDGTTVKTLTTPPFEFVWDTQTVADGEHTITTVVTDKSGNSKTVEAKVKVQNTLLEFDAPEDFLGDSETPETGYIFLSDKDGKLITARAYENGEHVVIKSPTYTGSTFTVTEVVKSPMFNSTSLLSTTGVSRGHWVLTGGRGLLGNGEPAGVADLNCVNAAVDVDYNLRGTNGSVNVNEWNLDARLMLYYNPSMVFATTGDYSKWAVFSSVKVGSNTIDLSKVTNTFTEKTLSLPAGFASAHVSLEGLHTATTTDYNVIELGGFGVGPWSENPTEFTIKYPENAFPAYYSRVSLEGDGVFAYNATKTVYDLNPLGADIEIALKNDNELSGVITGTADFVTYDIVQGNPNDNETTWTFITTKGTQSLIIPEIPAIISGFVSIALKTSDASVTACDYAKIDGYDGLLSFMRTSTQGLVSLKKNYVTEWKELRVDLLDNNDDGGGRQGAGTHRKPHHFAGMEKRQMSNK